MSYVDTLPEGSRIKCMTQKWYMHIAKCYEEQLWSNSLHEYTNRCYKKYFTLCWHTGEVAKDKVSWLNETIVNTSHL